MKKRIAPAVAVVALIIAAAAYAQGSYSYQNDIKPVLDNNCVFCHSFAGNYQDLMAKVSEYPPVGIPIVNPEKPDSSMIVWRLEGQLPSGAAITRMPQGGNPLSEDTIQMFRAWIAAGAPEETPVGVRPVTWGEMKSEYR